ncbi:unnamed protein product [Orchesella dallaii]|uniref:BTB domain-containing protein n=1 Tax=Orchesella dallaii TaxID=48710 RepID=A0ABP1PSH8_9HEXA
MNLILIDELSTVTEFRRSPSREQWDIEIEELAAAGGPSRNLTGSIDMVIRCTNPSAKGRGVDAKNRFHWKESVSALSERLRGKNNSFSIRVAYTLLNYNTGITVVGMVDDFSKPKMKVEVTGDFEEIIKYVFNQVPNKVGLNLEAKFGFANPNPNQKPSLIYSMVGERTGDGDIFFEACPNVSPLFAKQVGDAGVANRNMTTVVMTLELTGLDCNELSSPQASGFGLGSPVGRALLEEADTKGEFDLVADNGVKFPCHKMFLSAATPYFKRMFANEFKEVEDNACKLQLPEEGVKLLREFIYCGTCTGLEERAELALDLLEAAHVMEITLLEEAVKTLILKMGDTWLGFQGGMELFVKANRWGEGFEGMKLKAVKAIKLTPEEIKTSPECAELFKTDCETAMELLYCCTQRFPGMKVENSEEKGSGDMKRKVIRPFFSSNASSDAAEGDDWNDVDFDEDDDDADSYNDFHY